MGTKNLNSATDLITFTRASSSTFLGSNGLIQTATNNTPRIEYNPDGTVKGLLIEEARTNKVAYSQDFTQSYWNKQELTVAAAPVAAPDGTMTATHVVKTGSNPHLVRTNIVSTADRHSIWAKTVSGTGTMYISWSQESTLVTVTEEWQRFDVQCDNTHVYAVDLRGGATLTEVYIWGSQAETGTFPTSYIPTTGSTATRAVDVATILTANFGYNSDAGSVVAEVSHFTTESGAASAGFAFDDGSSSNRMYYYQNKGQWIGSVSGSTTFNMDTTDPLENSDTKVGAGYKKDNVSLVVNSSIVGNDTSTDIPSVNKFYFGSAALGNYLNGHIKSIKYYPRRLSNAQLQELTT